MELFDYLLKKNEKSSILSFMNNNKENDKELDSYGLENWQKEEIRKSNCDPYSFEEDEIEEDDYYSEDE